MKQHKLNLGCGKKVLKGFINVDYKKVMGVDVVHDLNKRPYPFKEGSANFIIMDNVLEHLDDIVSTMEELHRILKPGGRLEVIVPYFTHPSAYQDPTHKHFFTLRTFSYFDERSPYAFYSNARFRVKRKTLLFSKSLKPLGRFLNKHHRWYEQLFIPYLIPASGIRYLLEAVK